MKTFEQIVEEFVLDDLLKELIDITKSIERGDIEKYTIYIKLWNAAYSTISGYTSEEDKVLGLSKLEAIPIDVALEMGKAIARTTRGITYVIGR